MNTRTQEQSIGIILLAAGTSTRLGEPKQLLRLPSGTSLVRQAAMLCIDLQAGPVTVVTGAYRQQVELELEGLDCNLAYHEQFADGMGTSIAYGVGELAANSLRGYLIVLVDQPYLTADVLQQLVDASMGSSAHIVVSKYDIGQGPPSYFPVRFAEQLQSLTADHGAKIVIEAHRDQVSYISFANGSKDVDNPSDKMFLKGN